MTNPSSWRGRPPGATRIGPYEIQGMIGKGGAGAVYRARSPEGREVAVKVLAGGSRDQPARFEREARLLGSLGEAEGFVPLLDEGTDGPTAYIVMPFVPGGTLRPKLERGPLGVEATVALVRSLAAALGRAHEKGIVHRDLKPENILFAKDGTPLVADLGLAKHYDGQSPGASQSISLSVGGEMRGTAGYMSPEQMTDARSVGPPSDVFALGAIAWECLAGEPAFMGATLMEVIAKTQEGKRRPLSVFRNDVPRWLAAVIDRALATDPNRRFEDGAELARAFDARATAKGRRPLLAAFLLVAIAAVAAVAWPRAREKGTTPAPSAPTEPPRATAAELATLRSSVFARATNLLEQRKYVAAVDETRRAFEKSRDPWIHALLADCLLDAGDVESALAIVASFSEGAPGEPRARAVHGYVLVRRNHRAEARALLGRAVALEPMLGRALTAASLDRLAAARERPQDCDAIMEEAVRLARRAVASPPPGRAVARRTLCEVLKAISDESYKDAREPEAVFDMRSDASPFEPERIDPSSEAGLVLAARRKAGSDTENAAREAIALDPLRPITHALLGRALSRQGQDPGPEFARAVALDAEDTGVLGIIARTEVASGRLASGREAIERALRVVETQDDLVLAGHLAAALGDDDAALRAFERAAKQHEWSHLAEEEVARLHVRRGALDRALDAANGAVSDAPTQGKAWWARSEVLTARGDLDGALADANRAITLANTAGEGYIARARVRLARKELPGALADCDLALKERPLELEGRFTRGLILLASGDREAARADLSRFLELSQPFDLRRKTVKDLLETALR